MVIKPTRFSQFEVRTQKISPEELDSWIEYVRNVKRETLEQAMDKPVSVNDFSLSVCLFLDNEPAYISVKTVYSGCISAYFDICKFKSNVDAKNTFNEYAKFKNMEIIVRDDDFNTKQEIKF